MAVGSKTGNAKTDVLIRNARIWTGDPSLPYAEAMAIQGDRIVAIGTAEQVKAVSFGAAKVLDAEGHWVLPGFIDNHTHLLLGGFQLLSLDLRSASSKETFIQSIANQAAQSIPGTWITGGGWNNDQWTQPTAPVSEWIDSFTTLLPVYLTRSDLHIAFANRAALRLAGIGKNTADPLGGVIERDPYTGEPTGILKDNAMKLVQQYIPQPTQQHYDAALRAAMQHAARLGITSVQDITAWTDWQEWETLRRFQERQQLTLRIYSRTQITEWEKQLTLKQNGFQEDAWLRLGGVKGFVDGSLGSGTALMFEPYADEPGAVGLLAEQMIPEGIMLERIAAADKAGLPVSIHAIGDKANHLLLTIFEAIIRANGPRDRRFRIEHAQHLIAQDIARMARLGILASVQPIHAYEDGCWAEKRIGIDRCQMTYPFRSLHEAGVSLSFGTDWPVASLNPFLGIYTATTRKTQDGQYPDGWVPQQKLELINCLRAYTSGSAYAEFGERVKGTLSVGKYADLIIIEQDLFTISADEIPKTRVLLTMAGGKIVYQE